MNKAQNHCDLLVISPHTDDAEIGLGATMATLAGQGKKVWAVDLTRGEMGTNATPDQRWEEAARASEILGLYGRVQLSLPDGFIDPNDRQHLEAVVWALRTFRPGVVISAPDPVRHPDHVATLDLVQRAVFLARLVKLTMPAPQYRCWEGGASIPTDEKKYSAPTVFSVCPEDKKPSLLFDVSENWHLKEKSLACYASQFKRDAGRLATHINTTGFLEKIDRRALRWGEKAGTTRAEAFCTENLLVTNDFSDDFGWRP